MNRPRSVVLLSACILILWSSYGRADDPLAVATRLSQAKIAWTDARTKAKSELIAEINKRIKDSAAKDDLDAVAVLVLEKNALTASGTLPTSTLVASAAANYTRKTAAADAQISAVYEDAAKAYSKQSKNNEALETRSQLKALLAQSQAGPDAATQSADPIAADLEHVKSDYIQTIGRVKSACLKSIDDRISAVSDTGDLKAVEALELLKTAVDGDGTLPGEVNDPAAATAKKVFEKAVLIANRKLAIAYRQAVRDYTKARKIHEAEHTQSDFEATGLSKASTAELSDPDNSARLTASLPSFLTAEKSFSEVKEGIKVPDNVYIHTKDGNFLERDFLFDVFYTIDAKQEGGIVGIGSAVDGEHGTPMNSIFMELHADGRVALSTREGYGSEQMGRETDSGTYIARVEKHGMSVTLSVGTERDGKFIADITKLFADITRTPETFNGKNMHLFFGSGGLYKQVRFVDRGNPTSTEDEGQPLPATPVVIPGVK